MFYFSPVEPSRVSRGTNTRKSHDVRPAVIELVLFVKTYALLHKRLFYLRIKYFFHKIHSVFLSSMNTMIYDNWDKPGHMIIS